MADNEADGITLRLDFDTPFCGLLVAKSGDSRSITRLTHDEMRALARRLNRLADTIEPASGDVPLGTPWSSTWTDDEVAAIKARGPHSPECIVKI